MVAFGRDALPLPSGGRVMRAVSFFGAAFETAPGAAAAAPGRGFKGTVGWEPTPGARGGAPAMGFAGMPGTEGALGTPGGRGGAGAEPGALGGPGGRGGAGAEGAEGILGRPGAGGGATGAGGVGPPTAILVVSFFGVTPEEGTGRPGRLIRTVSRLATGCSCLGGRVIRMVSALEASSFSAGAGEFSSAMVMRG